MPPSLNLPDATLLWNLSLIMGSKKPLVFIDIASTKVGRFIIVGCMLVIEELERSKTTPFPLLSRLYLQLRLELTWQCVHLRGSLNQILDQVLRGRI